MAMYWKTNCSYILVLDLCMKKSNRDFIWNCSIQCHDSIMLFGIQTDLADRSEHSTSWML